MFSNDFSLNKYEILVVLNKNNICCWQTQFIYCFSRGWLLKCCVCIKWSRFWCALPHHDEVQRAHRASSTRTIHDCCCWPFYYVQVLNCHYALARGLKTRELRWRAQTGLWVTRSVQIYTYEYMQNAHVVYHIDIRTRTNVRTWEGINNTVCAIKHTHTHKTALLKPLVKNDFFAIIYKTCRKTHRSKSRKLQMDSKCSANIRAHQCVYLSCDVLLSNLVQYDCLPESIEIGSSRVSLFFVLTN